MRLPVVLLLTAGLLTGCGGGGIDRAEYERLQDEVDSAARITAITVSEALTATLPPGTSLGTGRSASCAGGVVYTVDTFVTHEPMDAEASLRQVAKEIRREGYAANYRAQDAEVTADVGDVFAEVRSRGQDEQPTGHLISVTTGCLEVTADLASELVNVPARDVRR